MDLPTFTWLLTPPGQALLDEAMSNDLGQAAQLRTLERLRRHADPERASAAYEIALLRLRAAAKFPNAAAMYFIREALEQASGEQIAGYRAGRYQGYGRVADLCCGIGGDTLALARQAPVVAADRDALRLAMAAANARACGLDERATFAELDLSQAPAPSADAIFFDPARRSAGRRVFSLDAYQPSIELVRGWHAATPAIGIKIAPGVSDEDLAWVRQLAGELGAPLEVEFISVGGELKEAVLWLGPLATTVRRATVLAGGPGDTAQHTLHDSSLADGAAPPLEAPAAYLYEPDPAIIRAHLVAALAQQLGAAQLDRTIAYLTAETAQRSPFARCWQIIEWLPFNLKRLRARLAALDAGPVTVKKRGSPLETDALARQLSGGGSRPLVVVLTRIQGQAAALIGSGPIQPAESAGA